jgi:predicted RNase H-like HicB family nuclease
MGNGTVSLTAVYLKLDSEYFGFVEELPRINSRGRTLHEARAALQTLAAEVFAEERLNVAETHTADSMVRESFVLIAPQRLGKDA